MKKQKDNFYRGMFLGFLVTINLLLFVFSVFYYFEKKGNEIVNKEIPLEINEIILDCNYDDLIKTAQCVNSFTNSFYKYNLSMLGKEIENFDELKINGGVCSHWADYYCEIGRAYGFNVKIVSFSTDKENNLSHVFCVWSNADSYAVLDQQNIFSFSFQELDLNEINKILEDERE